MQQLSDAELAAMRRPAEIPFRKLSDAQLYYINALLDERVIDPKFGLGIEEIRKGAERLSVGDASRWINRLKQLPKRKPQPVSPGERNMPDVRQGRYAIRNKQGDVKFYRVDRPTEGRWEGHTFLSAQASDALYPVKSLANKRAILRLIAKDPIAAFALYGQELGVCGVCGATLTNEDSRRIGIGPVCRRKLG